MRVCLARGELPCHVLFVGEAPGEAEDLLGRPFVGPAGKLLDFILTDAFRSVLVCPSCGKVFRNWREGADACPACGESSGGPLTWALTNLVGCVPWDEDGDGRKTSKPPDEAVRACAPRLEEVVALASPRLVVAVGAVARDRLTPGYRYSAKLPGRPPVIDIAHPAWLLRMDEDKKSGGFRDLEAKRIKITLRDALARLGPTLAGGK